MWFGSGLQRCCRVSAGRIRRDARRCRDRWRRKTDTCPREPGEGRSQMAPTVLADDDLVEVALDVLLAKAVELEGSQIRPVDGFARQRPSPTA